MRPLFLALLLYAVPVFAQDFGADFSTAVTAGSGTTAVVNQTRGNLHVPFVVDRTCDSGSPCTTPGTENETIDLGNGSDGVFDAATATNFDINHGSTPGIITLDSARDYQFTTFALPAGDTLHAVGNRPLMIHVQGDMTVDGNIDVSGGDGEVPSNASTPRGGTACCSGMTGGDGGDAVTMSGRDGGKFDTGILSAGRGGGADAASAGGGGGGGSVAAPGIGTPTTDGAVAGGAGGIQFTNAAYASCSGPDPRCAMPNPPAPQIPNVAGSGGGGGGRSGTMSGGAGGAGGGAILIQVGGNLTVSPSGHIYANGGRGGGGIVSGEGCGGGGGGGAALLFVGGSLIDNDSNGITANGGQGGGSATAGAMGGCGGGIGGDGAKGVLRLVGKDGTPISTGGFSGSESPPPPIKYGTSLYTLSPVVFNSSIIDTHLTNASIAGIDVSDNATGTITYQYAGSNDGFVSDDTGWLTAANISQLSGKRYLRFRITLQAVSRTASPEVSFVQIHTSVPQFDYRLAGCARIHPRGASVGGWWTLFFLLYLVTLPRVLRPLARRAA